MTRCNSPVAWDFIKVGGLYQYKEDAMISIVEVLSDTSDDGKYEFLLHPLASNMDVSRNFTCMSSKENTMFYSGKAEFFQEMEYAVLPIGARWPYIFDPDKLEGSEFIFMEGEKDAN